MDPTFRGKNILAIFNLTYSTILINMTRVIVFFTSFLLLSTSFLSLGQESIDTVILRKIKEEGLSRSHLMNTAFYLTDVCGPRLTGSPGLIKAQNWTIERLRSWGINNGRREAWGKFGKGWEVKKNYAAITSPYYQAIIAVPKAWTPGTGAPLKSEVVLVKADTVSDLERYKGKLRGKIVILDTDPNKGRNFKPDATRLSEAELRKLQNAVAPPQQSGPPKPLSYQDAPWLFEMFRKNDLKRAIVDFLKGEGAALILSQAGGAHGTLFTSTGASHNADAPTVIPELETSGEDYQRILRLLKNGIKVSMEAEIETSFYTDDMEGYNVMAELPGTDKKVKDEVVMIGGHLDSWHASTGATDNAAGVAVTMEAMRILKALNFKPKRTIRLALWDAEEQSFKGSRQYVYRHYGNRQTMQLKEEHSKLSAYYNLDIGTGRIQGIYLQRNAAARKIFESWFAPLKDLSAGIVTINSTGSTDHESFDDIGLPGFQFIQDPLDYDSRTHHTNQDSFDKLSESDLKQAAIVIAWFAYNTAQRTELMPRKALPSPLGK
jgi:hypothetical protein